MVGGRIEMDHAGQGVNMDTSCDDVRCDQCVGLSLGKRIECSLPLTLGTVAVHRDRTDALRLELSNNAVGTTLGATEHEGLSVVLNQLRRDRHSIGALDPPEVVRHITLCFFRRFDVHPDRVPLIVADDRLHFASDGGREKENLAIRGCLVEQSAHRWEKPHVGHAIRFVEHDRRDVVEKDVTPLDQVLETPGTGNHDVDTLVQGAHLIAVTGTTKYGDDAFAIMPEKAPDDLVHLRGQFARRHQDESCRSTGARLHRVDDEREAEGQGLP